MPLTALDAACKVLREAGEPLHYQEITRRVLDGGLWRTQGKTPSATVNARLAVDIKQPGSRFRRVAPGIYSVATHPDSPPGPSDPTGASGVSPAGPSLLSFLDAAEKVLRDSGSSESMHYTEITKRAIEAGLIQTRGKTPAISLNAQVGADIRRREERGEPARFVRLERGKIGLAQPLPEGIAGQIEAQNRRVREQLLERVRRSTPAAFERLVGELLEAIGFEEVTVTSPSTDNGIDVRGTLVVAGVVRLRMAVQARCWARSNVGRPVVQQVRGSLGTHEQGLIITTSGFSKSAQEEARRPDAPPVFLMDGEQMARLLAEEEIGAKRTRYNLWTLQEPEDIGFLETGTPKRQPVRRRRPQRSKADDVLEHLKQRRRVLQ